MVSVFFHFMCIFSLAKNFPKSISKFVNIQTVTTIFISLLSNKKSNTTPTPTPRPH